MGKISKLTKLLLILLTICTVSYPANAEKSFYVFDSGQSVVVKTGGFAGVHITYTITGQFRLIVDSDAGIASFVIVDANLTDETGAEYGRSLEEIFNMTGLASIVVDDTTIQFEGKTADGTESDVRLTLSFMDGLARMTGNTTPPPNSADLFFYDVNAVAIRKYAGGIGEPNDPYRIATAEDLITLGETSEDYDKHFILTADIDLDPNLPGRKVFDRAVIAPDIINDTKEWFQGTGFSGYFDGNDHMIANLTIVGSSYLGLFGDIASGAKVVGLGLEAVDVNGSSKVGSLAGLNFGIISSCYSTGVVTGIEEIGGLVGSNGGNITMCYSACAVTGDTLVGGLAGFNCHNNITKSITASFSTSTVSGDLYVGGLVGGNGGNLGGKITTCYSTGTVSGNRYIGGLVGINSYGGDGGAITNCYSTGMVTGNDSTGGLVGVNASLGSVTSGLWDMETSGQTTSDGGVGKTTAEMQEPNTFIAEGWDFVSMPDGPHDIWIEPEGGGYPMLWWQSPSGFILPAFAGGNGEPNDPYLISTPEQLSSIGHNPKLMESHFRPIDNLDVMDMHFYPIGSTDYPYRGIFDGNDHTISHLVIKGVSYLGLFSVIGDGAEVKNLGIVDVNITGLDSNVGGLVGLSWESTITNCFSTGVVSGGDECVGGLVGKNDKSNITNSYSTGSINGDVYVGGLVGYNDNGNITESYSISTVIGGDWNIGGLVGTNSGTINKSYSADTVTGTSYNVGGLVGENADWKNSGTIINCYSNSTVNGNENVGGLVGENAAWMNSGSIINCYNTGTVIGYKNVGGVVGSNGGNITFCYNIGMVSGEWHPGGLVGSSRGGSVNSSFWDAEISGQPWSQGGTGKTTNKMKTISTFLDAGWDFVDETKNGTEDIWWILEEQDYPRLSWELGDEMSP